MNMAKNAVFLTRIKTINDVIFQPQKEKKPGHRDFNKFQLKKTEIQIDNTNFSKWYRHIDIDTFILCRVSALCSLHRDSEDASMIASSISRPVLQTVNCYVMMPLGQVQGWQRCIQQKT